MYIKKLLFFYSLLIFCPLLFMLIIGIFKYNDTVPIAICYPQNKINEIYNATCYIKKQICVKEYFDTTILTKCNNIVENTSLLLNNDNLIINKPIRVSLREFLTETLYPICGRYNINIYNTKFISDRCINKNGFILIIISSYLISLSMCFMGFLISFVSIYR